MTKSGCKAAGGDAVSVDMSLYFSSQTYARDATMIGRREGGNGMEASNKGMMDERKESYCKLRQEKGRNGITGEIMRKDKYK